MATDIFGAEELQARKTASTARDADIKAQQNTTAPQPAFGYSLMLYYGQSKCIGEQGYPALTTTPAYPNAVFMLGGSPRPVVLDGNSPNANLYTTFVDENFHPLICTNQARDSSTFLTFKTGALTANHVTVAVSQSGDATFSWAGPPSATSVFANGDTFQCLGFTVATENNAVATNPQGNVFTITSVPHTIGGSTIVANGFLSAQSTTSPESGILFAQVPAITDLNFGEEAGVTQLNELYALQLDYSGPTQDTFGKWVMANGGVSGQTIAELSKDAPPGVPNNLYNRILDAATIFSETAGGFGETYGMPAVLFNQGGSDEGSGTPRDQYKASYEALVDDVTADIAVGIFSQSAPPFWFGIVVDGGAINTGIIAQAQMELFGCSPATGFNTPYTPNMYMIGGSYQMPDHGNHLSQNGYRWLGAMSAKVMNKVMVQGQGWLPLHLTAVTYRGGQVLLDFYVPEPPLQIKPVFVIQALTTLPHLGFSVYYEGNELAIGSVTLASATSILITLATVAPAGAPTVSYADMNNAGSGNICDSDPTVALDNWIFTAGNGQYLTENFPDPVSDTQIVSNNEPYPLWNFLCPFTQIQAVPG